MILRPVAKDQLYYDRWRYSMSFFMLEANVLKEMDHGAIDLLLQARQKWREISQQRFNHRQTILATDRKNQTISDETMKNLHSVADTLILSVYEYKSVVSTNNIWIYSNDLELFAELAALPFIQAPVYTEARVTRPKNTVVLQRSKHKYRSYFRMVKLCKEDKKKLENFLRNSEGSVRLAPSLKTWLDNNFVRLQDYFFVDHSESTWLTMLGLVHPGLIRKTLQIHVTK
jgi:hypothetical protein